MKRDDDYFRALLMELEASEKWLFLIPNHMNMSADEHRRAYHLHLASDAGLISPVGRDTIRLTNDGHDFIANIRNDTVWNKTKDAATKLGGVSLSVLKELSIAFVKEEARTRFGLPV